MLDQYFIKHLAPDQIKLSAITGNIDFRHKLSYSLYHFCSSDNEQSWRPLEVDACLRVSSITLFSYDPIIIR